MQSLVRRTLHAGARLGPRVGLLAGAAALSLATVGTASLDAPPSALSPAEFKAFKLTKIEKISHDTALYRCAARCRGARSHVADKPTPRSFALPDSKQSVGLPTASCMVTKCVCVPRLRRTGSASA
jgi:hypothetical protein